MKDIFVIHKNSIEAIPPLLSIILNFVELGYKVSLLTCGIEKGNYSLLQKKNVDIQVVPFNEKVSLFGKIIGTIKYRNAVYKALRYKDRNNTLLFVEGGNTVFAIGARFKQMLYDYILFLPELLEDAPYQRMAIARVIDSAKCVFVPEYNRSYITKVWFKLEKQPIVLPNKPYFEPANYDDPELLEKYHKEIALFKSKRIILYQGHVAESRNISKVIQAVKELGDNYQVVLMGKDYGIVEKYKKIDPKVVHIPFIPAPDYLLLTRLAYIGVLVYTPDMLNTIFCAPNKIFEYTKYGLPVIGNDIPGLRYPIEMNKIGSVANYGDVESIKDAIRYIEANYDDYKKNSFLFYDSIDNKSTIKKALESFL